MFRGCALFLSALLTLAWIGPSSALDCGERDPFVCLQDHANAELKRLKLTPTDDQKKSFQALNEFSVYREKGAEAAVADWEEKGLPVYDLILTLLLADQKADARKVALAATKKYGVFDANNEELLGEKGFEQMKKDLKSYYYGEEDMVYARACVSDEAFKKEIGGGASMRKGACRAPYDTRSVQRAFGMMQLVKGISSTDAVEATMQYAYRVPSCAVATAVLEVAPTSSALGEDNDTAAWKVLDMATVCAAELLIGMDL